MIFLKSQHCNLQWKFKQELANDVANRLGVKLGGVILERFADGECNIQILENVRRDIFIIQSTQYPVNENLMELFYMLVLQEEHLQKKLQSQYCIMVIQDRNINLQKQNRLLHLTARLLEKSGIDHLVQSICTEFFELSPPNQLTLVSPDFNGISRAKITQDELRIAFPNPKTSFVIQIKVTKSEAELNLVNEVDEKNCYIIDDIVDSARTIKNAINYLKQEDANQIMACAAHPVLSGKATLNLRISIIDKLHVADTIPIKDHDQMILDNQLTVLNVTSLITETIFRLQNTQSLW